MLRCMVLAILLLSQAVSAQDDPPADPWQPLRFLEGSWEGRGDGLAGISTATQSYEFVLGGNFLQMKARSVFEPQEKKPDGEIHEDMGMFSYDRARETFVLRSFYVEGFVNTFVLHEISEDGNTVIFVTEAVENAPPGTEARLEFERISDDEMEERFFVAFPEKEFGCISTNRLKKK